MPKRAGFPMRLFISGYDISGDIGAFDSIHGGPAYLDVTDITQEGQARIGGVFTAGVEFTSYFNPATDRAHDRLSLLPTTDQLLTGYLGSTLGSPGFGVTSKQINYEGTRGKDGDLTFKVNEQSTGTVLDWGELLTSGIRTDIAATNGAGVDAGASSTFVGQAYLQVLAFTGTSATITIQDSPDNSVWAALAGGVFTTVTGRTSERIRWTEATTDRWLRVVTTGTFTNLQFVVVAARNLTAVAA